MTDDEREKHRNALWREENFVQLDHKKETAEAINGNAVQKQQLIAGQSIEEAGKERSRVGRKETQIINEEINSRPRK